MSLAAAAVALSLLVAVPVAAGPKRPAGGFTFHGSGYGHGLGMGQFGMLGLAQQGWEATRIVRHYYSKVDVGPKQPARPDIRVGLLQMVGSVRLIAANGGFALSLQSGQAIETVPAGSRRTLEVTADRRFRIIRPDGTLVGDTTWGGSTDPVIAIREADARIRVADWGHEIGHGLMRFEVAGEGRGHLVAVMPVEEYVLGIAEVPSSWPKAALGAQAIAARTYGYWRLAGGMRAGCGCDVFSTVADQNYVGWDKLAAAGGDRWAGAARDTERIVATYQGAPIYAAYSSSSGGYTEDIEKVWPGSTPLPYLRGVCDPADDTAANPSRFWQASFDPGHVTTALKPYTGDIGAVTGFSDWRLGVSGRVTRVTVVGSNGSRVLEGWDIRGGLTLKDTRFSVNRNLNIRGEIRQAYDAAGCRPGRATGGQRKIPGGRLQAFVSGRIYEHLKRNTAVWLRGAVLSAYLNAGGHASRLRLPYRIRRIRGGQRVLFDGGTITCGRGCRVRFG